VKIDIGQLEFIDSLLRTIVMHVEDVYGVEFTITSLLRIKDSGTHGTLPLRAIDLRCRDEAFGDMVADYINSIWIYNPNKPNKMVCVAHGHGANYHLHFQVHHNTRTR